MSIRLKRVYEKPADDDGDRILVDRLWPRGVSKQEANIKLRLREIAPSDELRKWYGHLKERWPEFRQRYLRELEAKTEELSTLRERMKYGKRITLGYAARDTEHNQAVVLLECLGERYQDPECADR